MEQISEAEKYYHSLLTFGMIPGLERIENLLNRLGNPQNELKFIHVAGTNGKGTVCVFLSEILKRAGFKTGLYTSPYIVDFRERIRVNGEMISPESLDEVTRRVKIEIDALNSENIVITEFEAVTAAAFLYFKKANCDFVVLETGLGGRFDATNVIKRPEAAVITSISLDHTKILGETLPEIAFEKCGIIKNNRPVVTSSTQCKSVLSVISQNAGEKSAPLTVADFGKAEILSESFKGSCIKYKDRQVFVPFAGAHQIENCLLALETADLLKSSGVRISEQAIRDGIAFAENPGRCEIVSSDPLVILDGCHNEGSAAALSAVLTRYFKDKKIKAVIGMMADKAVDRVLDILLPHFNSAVAVEPSNPRAVSAETLRDKILDRGVYAECEKSPEMGVKKALQSLSQGEILIVCGSLYLCSDVRKIFIK
ncbi:MAG: bifunctional folylpolyglutamate synthase/dihydrofolate synthase [Clostridiales bacterium]|nr:bifunctional folylpolyglutamate synthase/dihydrofolate synthase [Clostridiales bacterium]